MGLQDQWIKQIITQSKLNNMTIIGGLSAYLAALTNKQKGEVIIAYETSGAFTQWHLYVWDGVSAWVDLTSPKHTHTGGTDNAELEEIIEANSWLFFYNEQLISIGQWHSLVSGTGAAFDSVDDGTNRYNRHATGTTTTGFTTSVKGGIKIDFDSSIQYITTWRLSGLTNQAFIFGVAAEAINIAPTNTAKFGIEWCDAQATPNYYMMSASGAARSLSDSGVAMTTGLDGVKITHTPGSSLNYKFDNGVSISKASNIPAGASSYTGILRNGIKNNNAGAANRELQIMGVRLVGDRRGAEWVT